tara:strand:+ start:1035 stop:1451 length:417 start_codon:yes stop_codon:yes gene_type:complete
MKKVLGIVDSSEHSKKDLMEKAQKQSIEIIFVDPEGTQEEIAQALEANPDLVFFNLGDDSYKVVDELRSLYKIIKESHYKGNILTTDPSAASGREEVRYFYKNMNQIFTDHTFEADGSHAMGGEPLVNRIKKYLKAEK